MKCHDGPDAKAKFKDILSSSFDAVKIAIGESIAIEGLASIYVEKLDSLRSIGIDPRQFLYMVFHDYDPISLKWVFCTSCAASSRVLRRLELSVAGRKIIVFRIG
jgi:hypothetical protein